MTCSRAHAALLDLKAEEGARSEGCRQLLKLERVWFLILLQMELVLMAFGLQPKETDFGLLTPRTVRENISVLASC